MKIISAAWTDDAVRVLKELWAEGVSTLKIADRLPINVSASAVSSKASRLGLPARENPVQESSGPLAHNVVRALHMRVQKLGLTGKPQEQIMEAFAFTETASVAQVARALGYTEKQVEQALDRAIRGFHRQTPADDGHEGWQAE